MQWRLREYEGPQLSVDELYARWAEHARTYYRDREGKSTSEKAGVEIAVRSFRDMYTGRKICDLRHRDMLAWRSYLEHSGICRLSVNKRLSIFRRMMRWALDEDIVSPIDVAELTQVQPLKRYRSAAKEMPPVKPVDDATVDATCKALTPTIADMVCVHRHTGMRPQELCQLRWADIDKSATPWVYRPQTHKNDWRGRPRAICIGPKARAVLMRHADAAPDAPMFSPIQSEKERYAAMRAAAHAPSRYCRVNPDPAHRRKTGNEWTTGAYTKSIRYACKRIGVSPWGTNQLRHTFATEVRRAFGLTACRAVLGHSDGESGVTDRYSFDAIEDETIALAKDAVEALG